MSDNELMNEYAYVLVKATAAKSKLLKPAQLQDLLQAGSVQEFKSRFASIQRDISVDEIENSSDLEATFHDIFFRYMATLFKMAPYELQVLLGAYLQRYEVENLKNLLVSKIVTIEPDTFMTRQYQQVDKILHLSEIARNALQVKTIKEVVFLYQRTKYGEVLREIESRYEKTKEIFFIYALLDKFYIDELRGTSSTSEQLLGTQEYAISNFTGVLVDMYNVTIVLRGFQTHLEWDEIEVFLTAPVDMFKVSKDDLKAIFDAAGDRQKTADLLLSLSKRYSGGAKFVARIDPDLGLISIDHFFRRVSLAYLNYDQGSEIGVVMSFVVQKEIEVENLVTIYEGIKQEFDRDELKRLLLLEV